MKENYHYTLVELLGDRAFISFVNNPTPEAEANWNALLRDGKIDADDYELAAYCIRSFHSEQRSLSAEELSQLWANIQQDRCLRTEARRRRLFIRLVSAAASVLLLTGIFLAQTYIFNTQTGGFLAKNQKHTALNIEDVEFPSEEKSDDIQIISSNENHISLKEKQADIIYNERGEAEVNSQILAQTNSKAHADDAEAIDYSQILVPRGRHVALTLSDGSKVWLNACSRIVYPSVMAVVGKREIFIEGEAYIEVSPDADRPFVVKTNQLEVLALGTAFNVTAYDDEASQTVVLVNGRVEIQTKAEDNKPAAVLSPNQLFSLTGTDVQLKNVKVEQYTSWKDGIYMYNNEPLSHILKRLAHYYGVAIEYTSKAGAMTFTGKLDLKEDVERVLNGFSNTAPVSCRKENDTYFFSTN
ncbi:MAG: FecR domain-containing protein [Tannerella sp.]|jgi:ferric-dicitrate binding protein FerR (iron transport regulator)|nr:FecR domain-containing protein [Tannerella sp.]